MTFEQFVAARLAPLLRYATVVSCDPHLAEDIVQEVLLRAQSRWNRIGLLAQPEAYVKRMVLNEFLSWRRRRAAREVPLSHAGLDALASARADHAGGIGVRDELVRRIAALPPKQRAVIALRYYEGLADAEIAALLGCHEVTVRSQISRALAKLRGDYRAAGGPQSTGNHEAATGNRATGEHRATGGHRAASDGKPACEGNPTGEDNPTSEVNPSGEDQPSGGHRAIGHTVAADPRRHAVPTKESRR